MVDKCWNENPTERLNGFKTLGQLSVGNTTSLKSRVAYNDDPIKKVALATDFECQILFRNLIKVHVEHISDSSLKVATEAIKSLTCLFSRNELNKFLMPSTD